MRIWTIQPAGLFDTLQQQKVIYADFNQSQYYDFDDFAQAYSWLANQMTQRIGPAPVGVKVPFWAWHMVDWKHRNVELRTTLFRNYPDPTVCLELEIPDDQVFLSDFENWHFVLNNWYLGDARSDKELDAEDAWLDSLSEFCRQKQKRQSWTKIFNVVPFDDEWQRRGMNVQATFWELRLADVVGVRYFHWPPLKKLTNNI